MRALFAAVLLSVLLACTTAKPNSAERPQVSPAFKEKAIAALAAHKLAWDHSTPYNIEQAQLAAETANYSVENQTDREIAFVLTMMDLDLRCYLRGCKPDKGEKSYLEKLAARHSCIETSFRTIADIARCREE